MGGILTEDHLTGGGVLRRYDIHGVMLVGGADAGGGHLLGKARAQDLGPVQAQHRVDDERMVELDDQLLRRLPGLGQAVLGVGHVDVVVDVAVVGGEVSLGNAQGNAAVLAVEMDRRNDHVVRSLLSNEMIFKNFLKRIKRGVPVLRDTMCLTR